MAMTTPSKAKNVLLALWLSGSPGRKHLQGALRFANVGARWNVRLLLRPEDLTPDMIRTAETDGFDGLMVCATADNAEALAACRLPTVLMDFPSPALLKRAAALTMMFNDEEAVGAKGADYLCTLGHFSSYAFVPDAQNRGWSRLRERGFKAALAKRGLSAVSYNAGKSPLVDWLKALPKPAAIMAAFDFGAKEVLEECRKARLKVPDDISVLGVDNDELLCDYTRPTLSSIKVDHEAHGYLSAQILDRMMRARKTPGVRKVFCPPGEVVERESTHAVPLSSHLVNRACAFIAQNATRRISVGDVVAHLGVSRRLADLRFAQATGTSIRRAIEDRRLDEAKRLLTTTSLDLTKIAHLSGYPNAPRLKYVFKSRTGQTMSAWRRNNS